MILWSKVIFFIGLGLLGGFSIISWPDSAKGSERVVTHADFAPLRGLDPLVVTAGQDLMMCKAIHQSLLRQKFNSSEMEGDLAKSWSISEDGLVYTFKLRDDVYWHKGFGKFTAKDVKYTFDRLLDPKITAPYRKEIINDLKEVRVLDDYTIEFILKYPLVPFLRKLVGPRNTGIVCQKAVEKFGRDYTRNPIGTGPFIFESWTREQAVMVANKDFKQREGPPKIDKVIYKIIPDADTRIFALQKGEIDMMWLTPRDQTIVDRLKASGCKITLVKYPSLTNISMNTKKKPFDDIRVRRAVAHAIDKDSLIKYVYSGFAEPLNSPLPKVGFGHTEEGLPRYEYNPAKAKELLAQAGYPNGFEVNLDTDNSPSRLPVATALVEQLRQVNISVKLVVTDQPAWLKKMSTGTVDLIVMTPGYEADPDYAMMRAYHSSAFPPGYNVCKYDKIDDLIDKARVERNEKKRLEYYHQIQKKLMEDLPDVPLLTQDYIASYRSHISGVAEKNYVWGFDFYYIHFVEKK